MNLCCFLIMKLFERSINHFHVTNLKKQQLDKFKNTVQGWTIVRVVHSWSFEMFKRYINPLFIFSPNIHIRDKAFKTYFGISSTAGGGDLADSAQAPPDFFLKLTHNNWGPLILHKRKIVTIIYNFTNYRWIIWQFLEGGLQAAESSVVNLRK